jgi:23S rRNA (guanosine2251-2'-O)-methyltransferase
MNAPNFPSRARAGRRPPSARRAGGGGSAKAGALWIYGRHAVAAALNNPARRWRELLVLADREKEAQTLLAAAAARAAEGARLRILSRRELSAMLPQDAVHQGLLLAVEPLSEPSLEEALSAAEATLGRRVVVLLDRVQDPQNVGAVLRSAAAFGALAVILPAPGAPPAEGALAKAASGALERVPLLRATNLARVLDRLKEEGFWVCGLAESASRLFGAGDLGERIALVLGSEGEGMRRLVRERCDFLARLPTRAGFPTLNVANAAAVALYELMRPRGSPPASTPPSTVL